MLNDIFNILLPQAALGVFIILLLTLGMILSPRFCKYARLVSIIGISSSIALLSTVQTEPQYFGFNNSRRNAVYGYVSLGKFQGKRFAGGYDAGL